MKYLAYSIVLAMLACNKPPAVAPSTPQTTWIDLDTYSDTIITNINDFSGTVYYASKNWQQSANSTLAHGYRLIAVRYGDSILVKPLNDPSTNYDGPFVLKTNEGNDTLTAQNFLDTASDNPVRIFVLMH